MKTLNLSPFDIIARLIALLIALFGASAKCVARVTAMRGDARRGLAHLLGVCVARGFAFVRAGEDDATVDKRLARLQWIAADPRKAVRHMARRSRGLLRLRLGASAAPRSFDPPRLACAALADGGEALTAGPDI